MWRDRYISSYGFMEKESHEVAEETILINFVELDRFTKGLEESEGTVEKWCYALKHMWKLHDFPDGLVNDIAEGEVKGRAVGFQGKSGASGQAAAYSEGLAALEVLSLEDGSGGYRPGVLLAVLDIERVGERQHYVVIDWTH